MHHRASRPLLDLPRHLPRATARLIGVAAESRSGRLLVVVSALLSLAPAGYAVFRVDGFRTVHRPATAAATARIPAAARELDVLRSTVAREGDRQRDIDPGGIPTTPHPLASSPQVTDQPLAPAVAIQPAALAPPASRPTNAHSAKPTRRPTTHPTSGSKPTPRPTPSPRPTPTPPPQGTSGRHDTTAPSTTAAARYSSRNAVTLVLGSDEPASFACSLDGAAYTTCSSPARFVSLSPGWHSFAVRAIDAAGNIDPTPATVQWHARGGGR